MTRDSILRGIASYKHEQQVFLRLLRKRGSFTEHEFDAWFRGREWRRPVKAHAMTKETFILGLGANGGTVWAEWLELLQLMIVTGMVSGRREQGIIVYRSAEAVVEKLNAGGRHDY